MKIGPIFHLLTIVLRIYDFIIIIVILSCSDTKSLASQHVLLLLLFQNTIREYIVNLMLTLVSLSTTTVLIIRLLGRSLLYHSLGYERVYLPHRKVADTPFHIQGDDILEKKCVFKHP